MSSPPAQEPSSPNLFYDPSSSPAPQGQREPSAGSSSPFLYPSSSSNANVLDTQNSSVGHIPRSTNLRSDLLSYSSSLSTNRNSSRTMRSRRGDINASDLSSPRRVVTLDNMTPSDNGMSSSSRPGSEAAEQPLKIIWGTNVSIQECANTFREFLMTFQYKHRKELDGQEMFINETTDEELYYVNQMNQMRQLGTSNLNLDIRNLLAYKSTEKLYHQTIYYPQEIIAIMDQTVKDCMVSLAIDNGLENYLDEIESKLFKVRPYNVETKKGMRELNPNDIDKLVNIKGLVLRSTPIIPDMSVAFFKCNVCNHTQEVEIDRGVIQEPLRCPRVVCNSANSMVLIHNRCSFQDRQVVKLQETPDTVPDGQTPHSVSLCVYDELVDSCRAGDRIEVSGIFRSIPVRPNPKQRTLKSLYKTYIDVVHIKKVAKDRLGIDTSTVEQQLLQNQMDTVEDVKKISDEDLIKIKQISRRPDLYEVLSRSIAPSIYELDDIKKGILLQLFGGSNKSFKKGGRYRGDINILLCGDPSTSKSQILQYVHKIAPRGVYTSGKGSSAVGLTAYVTRDVDTKQLVLESGALVLSDGGVCCIDEFDKMSDSTRSVLHEVMEQQTISIAKAGIITTLNARTSVLASANPINSRYNPNLPVTANIDLPPPLLSRFDLVYLVLDSVNESVDRELARHLTSLYLEDSPDSQSQGDIIPVELLTSYINYAKQNFHPVITENAKTELVRSYVAMRKMGDDSRSDEKRITATTRQLESMIRLAEAHAKMRLSGHVEVFDVQEAVRLIKTAIKDYATDPKTGKIDMNLVQTGKSVVQRKLLEDLAREILNILTERSTDTITFHELTRLLNEQSQDKIDSIDISDALSRLQQEDKVVILGDSLRRSIRLTGRI